MLLADQITVIENERSAYRHQDLQILYWFINLKLCVAVATDNFKLVKI